MEENEVTGTNDIQNFLERRLGEKESQDVMHYINSGIEKNVEARVALAKEELVQWREDMKLQFASKEEALELKEKLVKRVSAVEGTIILWGFAFWFTLIIAYYIITKFVS